MKRFLNLGTFVLISLFSKAQLDSNVLLFEFADGISYQAKIEYDEPTKRPTIFSLGLGTIGEFYGGQLAGSIELERPINDNLALSARYIQSFRLGSNQLLNCIEIYTHSTIWSKTGKKFTRIKLFEAFVDDSTKRTNPYYGVSKLKVENSLAIDAGFSDITLGQNQFFQTIEGQNEWYVREVGNFFNLVVGPSFSRTQNYKLTFQDSSSKWYYSRFNVGINAGVNLWSQTGAVYRCSPTVCPINEASMDSVGASMNKFGLGFDLGYKVNVGQRGLIFGITLQGRYQPSYTGTAYFWDNQTKTTSAIEDYTFGSRLMFLPRLSLGYITNRG